MWRPDIYITCLLLLLSIVVVVVVFIIVVIIIIIIIITTTTTIDSVSLNLELIHWPHGSAMNSKDCGAAVIAMSHHAWLLHKYWGYELRSS